MKIKIFLSSRFDEFKDLREYIIEKEFKEIGLDIEIIALDREKLASFFSPKQESIEGVKESNIYMLFIGKTYGTIPNDDVISITYREYEEAKKLGLPILVFKIENEDLEEEIKKLLDEIEDNEIYGILTNNLEQDYELILNSLKKVITKLTSYGSKYIQNINKISFNLLKNKSEEFISAIGDRYIGNKYKINLDNDIYIKFLYIEKITIFLKLNELFYDNFSLKNLPSFIEHVPSYDISLSYYKNYLGQDEVFPYSKEEVIPINGFIYISEKILEWIEYNFNELILDNMNDFKIFLKKLQNKLQIIKKQIKIYNEIHSLSDLRIENESYYVNKMFIDQYLDIVNNIIYFNKSIFYQIFCKKKIILTGEALSGKTHVFCEVAKERLKNNQPTILFFGHQFHSEKSIIRNMIDLLDIDMGAEEFLEALNILGKKYNSRVLIMIDAINETQDSTLWQNEIISFSKKIDGYQNLSLAISIRDVEEYKLITTINEEFITENFIKIKHNGINPTLKEIENICKELGIEIISIPTHMFNLFVNPGIMWMYFELIKETTKKLDIQRIISPLDLFEEIFKKLNEKYYNQFLNGQKDEVLSDTLYEMIELGIDEDLRFQFDKRKLRKNLRQLNINPNILEFLKSEGILRENKGKIYFRYQKFENYFVIKYLLEKTDWNEKELLEKLLAQNAFALIESFILLLSQKNIEIFDLDETLLTNRRIVEFFTNSLIWRNEKLITKTTQKYFNKIIEIGEFKDDIFEMILHSSVIPNHPFNARYLHEYLKDFSIVKRDKIWSVYIHYSFENSGNVKKIIDWILELENVSFDKEIAFLYGITLSYFLTSSNRKLRDLVTKVLTKLFVSNLEIVSNILESFKNVNDEYIIKRILCAIYGAVLIVENDDSFYNIAIKVFDIVFKDKIIENIMIRDYGHLIVDFINNKIDLDFDISKIYPPYNSKLPIKFSDFNKLEKQYNKGYIYSITSSMRTEDMNWYGDFGRYTFQFAISNFIQDIPYKNWSAFAIEYILQNIIKNEIDDFENAELELSAFGNDRYDHKIERIGKKYQWIAMYHTLVIIVDNFKLQDERYWWSDKKTIDYQGSWQLNIRNIDPTLWLPKHSEEKNLIKDDFFDIEDEDNWLKSKKHLELENKIIFDNEVILHGYISKEKKINSKTKDFFYHIDSYIIKKNELNNFISWLNKNNFWGRGPLPEASQGLTQIYIKEYPNSKVYEYFNNSYYLQPNWCDMDGELPVKLLITYTRYLREGMGYDYSIGKGVEIVLPNKFLIDYFNLKQTDSGIWSRNDKKIIYDLGVLYDNDLSECLIIDKSELFRFINNSEYTIIWTIWAEKRIFKKDDFDIKDFKNSEFIGYGYFDKNNRFIENIRRENE